MAHFQVNYKNELDSINTVIVYADHCSEAIDNVLEDYPDVKEIISTKQLDSN